MTIDPQLLIGFVSLGLMLVTAWMRINTKLTALSVNIESLIKRFGEFDSRLKELETRIRELEVRVAEQSGPRRD